MDKAVIDGINAFLKKYDLGKFRKEYKFEAPKARNDMYKLFRGRTVGKKIIAEILKWAFHNDRRYLGSFLRNLDKNKENDVKKIIKEGLKLAKQGRIAEAIQKIAEIKGVGGVTASKILMFAMPKQFGMYDQFNGKAIYNLKVKGRAYFKKANPNQLTKKQYAEEFAKYTEILRIIGKKLRMGPADVDMALFRLGRGH